MEFQKSSKPWLMSSTCHKCGRPTLQNQVDVTPNETSQLTESARFIVVLNQCVCGWCKIYPVDFP